MKSLILAMLAVGLVGCADTHHVMREKTSASIQVRQGDKVLVGVSKDGHYATKNYVGSGIKTSQIIALALAGLPLRVEIAPQFMSHDNALLAGRQMQATYLIYPTILGWEDRATEWSGIPDRVEVKFEIIEVATGTTIDEGVINGKSGLATFGGDHPEDLLPKPVSAYIGTVFNK